MNQINCLFCSQKIRGNSDSIHNWWVCFGCPCIAWFKTYKKSDKIVFFNFTFFYKTQKYDLEADLQMQTCCLFSCARENHARSLLHQWSYIPDFNPQNIQAKMPTILTFL